MKLMEIGAPQSDQLIKALCNTLLHSLWQGVILAVIAGLIVVFTKKASAAMRYNLLVGALTLFAVSAAVTFVIELQKPAGQDSMITAYITNSNAGKSVITPNPGAPAYQVWGLHHVAQPVVQRPAQQDITQSVMAFLNTHYNAIVLIWFLIICAKSIQMAVGLQGVFHLKRAKVYAVSKAWQNKLTQLANQLHIRQSVRLLESGIAKVPMAIGHLKPVILIPIGLINSLSADEVEAILAHELAHIRRRDYLVNLLQSLMEILFFFNPAVLWISKLIKAERENCCDDIALAQTGNKAGYINALVSCEEHLIAAPAYSMALSGSKNTLLSRVKRMVHDNNQSLNMMEKALLTICLVCAGLGMAAFSSHTVTKPHHTQDKIQKLKPVSAPQKIFVPIKEDTAGTPQIKIYRSKDFDDGTTLKAMSSDRGRPYIAYVFKRNGTLYQINMIKENVASLLINEKQVPADKLDSYQSKINELLSEYNAAEAQNSANTAVSELADKTDNAAKQNSVGVASEAQNAAVAQPVPNISVPSGVPEPPSIIVPDFGDTLVKYGVIKDKRHIHAIFNSNGLVINGVTQPDGVFQMLWKKYGDNTDITYTNNGLPDTRMEENAYWAGQQRKIIDQMQREGLIENRKDLSFTLTSKTFVINGVVQGGDVFARYWDEYVPKGAGEDWSWSYPGPPGYYSAYANRYRNSGAYYQQSAAERQRFEAERDKKLVADLMQDGLITTPNDVTFKLSNKGMTVNGKKQSDEMYQRYKEKYVPNDSGGDWSWTYSHHE